MSVYFSSYDATSTTDDGSRSDNEADADRRGRLRPII